MTKTNKSVMSLAVLALVMMSLSAVAQGMRPSERTRVRNAAAGTLPSGSISGTEILDGTIANVDVAANAAIALTKLAAGNVENGTAASDIVVKYGTCTNGQTVAWGATYTTIVFADIVDSNATTNNYFSTITTSNGVAAIPGGTTNRWVLLAIE